MKNLVLKVMVAIVFVTGSYHEANSQASFLGNNSNDPVDFIGWDNTVGNPLRIRHDANRPIIFSTNTIERMRIAQWGNVAVGGVQFANPTAKFEASLRNDNAAAAPNFESTTISGLNRFQSEGDIINRAFRGSSIAGNLGGEDFNGNNFGGTFWATLASINVGVVGVAAFHENGVPGGDNLLVIMVLAS